MRNRLRFRRSIATGLLVLTAFGGAACSDDDKDGNPEVNVPEVDVDQGTDNKGD